MNYLKKITILFLILIVIGVCFYVIDTSAEVDCCYHECNMTEPNRCEGNKVYTCKTAPGCDNDNYNDWCAIEDCTLSGKKCVNGACGGTPKDKLTCADGTAYNNCSAIKGRPWFCDNSGNSVENCGLCGCAGSWVCGPTFTFCCDGVCNGTCSNTGCTLTKDPDCAVGGCCGDNNCDGGETNATCAADCPIVCTPDGCNGNCPAGCTVAQDADCACQDSNGCCGKGCDNANDNDCPVVCTPDGCNGSCPAGCTVAQDADCACQDSNGCCGKGCDDTNDNDCGGPPPPPPPPPPPCVSDGCNGNCPDGCSVAEDADCACQDSNGCCGKGCNNANDNDCPATCTPDGCNGNCPAGCTVVEDADCACQDSNGCCGKGCDNTNDNDCAINCIDDDNDGYGVCPNCDTINGCASDGNDCDDNEFWANPGGSETCDTLDNDCNNSTDEDCDNDNDGYCDKSMKVYRNNSMCSNTPFIDGRDGDDCNDNNFDIKPLAIEICGNNIDEDCDGSDLSCACVSDGCNGNCPDNCTVAEDADCACQDANACCGMGCNNTNDNDCPAVCVPDGCNSNCPAGCTVAQDADCACQDANACCGQGCDSTNDNDCNVEGSVGLGWSQPERVDENDNGAKPSIFYDPNGDLRIFYNVKNVSTKLMSRLRLSGQNNFNTESFVYNNGHHIALNHAGGGVIDAAISQGAIVVIVQSADNGANWNFVRSYSGGNNTAIFPNYNPLSLYEDAGELRLAYTYEEDSFVFGSHGEVYSAVRTGGVWGVANNIEGGTVRGIRENGNSVGIMTDRGVYYSSDNGVNYILRKGGVTIPTLLYASDSVIRSDGQIYILHPYSYGLSPSRHISFSYSDDNGDTWAAQSIVTEGDNDYYLDPKLIVENNTLVAIWQNYIAINKRQVLNMSYSIDGGVNWSIPETILTLNGDNKMESFQSFDIASDGDNISILYSVENSGRQGVYLIERQLPQNICISNGCNGDCPANCTVAQDADCACQDSNGCCGEGCNNANDNDCPLSCVDNDNDGYGLCPDCGIANGCANDGFDCDDGNNEINPGELEICGNNIDDDCINGDEECPCVESWSCGDWSACLNNNQNRICVDASNCGTELSKPIIFQICVPECFDECEVGDSECVGQNGRWYCEEAGDGDDCLEKVMGGCDFGVGEICNMDTGECEVIEGLHSPIQSPLNDQIFTEGDNVFFMAWAEGGVGPYIYSWESNISGVIESTENFSEASLPIGGHEITLTTTDANNSVYTSTINISVVSDLVIELFLDEYSYFSGQPVFLNVWVSGGTAPYGYFWESDKDGIIGSESSFMKDDLSVGIHNITINSSDSTGKIGVKDFYLEIKPPDCVDNDEDGYGTNGFYGDITDYGCSFIGYDCDDSNVAINSGVSEDCYNGIDDNCNGQIDECNIGYSILSPVDNVVFNWGEKVSLRIDFDEDVSSAKASIYNAQNNFIKNVFLYDDGFRDDGLAGDDKFGGYFLGTLSDGQYKMKFEITVPGSDGFSVLDSEINFTVVNIPECTSVFNSGSSEDKWDLVFIPIAFDDLELFAEKVSATSDYLLNINPFSTQKAKINIHRIDVPAGINANVFYTEVKLLCPTDTVVVFDTTLEGYNHADYYGDAFVDGSREQLGPITTHELGHAFAGLEDEYIRGFASAGVQPRLNCDYSPCNKWKDLPETECLQGCRDPNWYRSIDRGIMRSPSAVDFGIVNINHINSVFEKYR